MENILLWYSRVWGEQQGDAGGLLEYLQRHCCPDLSDECIRAEFHWIKGPSVGENADADLAFLEWLLQQAKRKRGG